MFGNYSLPYKLLYDDWSILLSDVANDFLYELFLAFSGDCLLMSISFLRFGGDRVVSVIR